MKSFKTGLAGFIVAVLAFSGLFMTCEIGLGDSVDTKAPKVSVLSPAVDSVIAGTFTLQGKASDETSLKGVSVSLVDTKSGATFGPYAANIDASAKSWSVSVNDKNPDGSYQIPDGMYQLTITAVDSANRSSVATTVYQIDNHLPTVLVTAPLSYGTDKTTFYRTIDIKGEAYDASTIQEVTVQILDAGGSVLASTIADGTNTWAARFEYSASDTTLTDNVAYSINVIAKDSANNTNTYYFHRSDIYTCLTAGPDGYVTFPSMNQIGRIDQGNVASTDNGLTNAELAALRHGTAATAPTIAFPDFIYRNQEPPKVQWLNVSDANETLGLNVPIVGTILPPTDGSGIVMGSIVFSITNKATSEIINQLASRVTLTSVVSSINFEVKPGDADNNNLGTGNYIIKLTYATVGGLTREATRSFGVSSGVPSLKETALTPDSSSPFFYTKCVQGSAILAGTAKTSDGNPANLVCTDTYIDPADLVEKSVPLSPTWGVACAYSIPLTFSDVDGTHTIKLTASSGGLETSLSRILVVDTKKPVLVFLNPTSGLSPTVAVSGSDYVMPVNGTADDGTGSGVSKVYCRVAPPATDLSSATDFASGWEAATGTINWSASVVVDQVVGATEGDKNLWVAAIDAAGNIQIDKVSFKFDIAKPVASFNAPTNCVMVGSTLTAKSPFTLSGFATDSGKAAQTATLSCKKDGIDFDLDSGSTELNATLSLVPATGAWSWGSLASITDTSNDGLYMFTLTANDAAGKTSTSSQTIRVDTTPPILTVTAPLAGMTTKVTTCAISATAADFGSGMDAVTYTMTLPDATTRNGSLTLDSGDSTWKGSLNLDNGEGTYVLSVTPQDKAGNAHPVPTVRTLYFDLTPPTVTETEFGPYNTFAKADFSLKGQWTESNRLSTLRIVCTDSVGAIVFSDDLTLTATNGTNDWAYDVKLTGGMVGATPYSLPDGEYAFTITATDASGAFKSVVRTITVDKNAPVILTVTDFGTAWLQVSAQEISVAVDTDAGSALDKVEYRVNGGTWTALNRSGTTGGGKPLFKGTAVFPEGAANTLEIKAVDMAKNESLPNATNKTSQTLRMDSVSPTLTITGPSGTQYKNNGTNASLIIAVKAEDVTSTPTTVFVSSDSTFPVTDTKFAALTETPALSGTYTGSVDAQELIQKYPAGSDGMKTLYVRVSDIAGNFSATANQALILDTTPPVASISSPSTTAAVNKTITLSGMASDSTALDVSKNVTIVVKNTSTNAWDTLGPATISALGSWEFAAFNTNAYVDGSPYDVDAAAGSVKISLRAVVSDLAGNASVDTEGVCTLTVDQDKDRPTLKINNLPLVAASVPMSSTNSMWLTGTKTLYGSVTDDDGLDGLTMKIRYKYGDATGYSDGTITVANGSWSYELPSGDGAYALEFIVTDAAKTDFTSLNGTTPEVLQTTMMLTDGTTTFAIRGSAAFDTRVYVKEDMAAPEVSIGGVRVGSDPWIESGYSAVKLGGAAHLVNGSNTPAAKTFELKGIAKDANGIKELHLVTSGLAGVTGDSLTVTPDPDTGAYTFSGIKCNEGTGPMLITVTATDNANNARSSTLTLAVDNTAPVVTVLNPNSVTTSSGKVTTYGSIDESPKEVAYAISVSGVLSPENASNPTSWADASGATNLLLAGKSGKSPYVKINDASFSWYAYFDGDTDASLTSAHSDILNTYLVNLGVTDQPSLDGNSFTSVVKLYLWVKATDQSGNVTEKSHQILLDPQGGRPKVTLSYPESDGVSLGDIVRLNGSATDDGSVKAVFAQLVSSTHTLGTYTARTGAHYGPVGFDATAGAYSTSTPTEADLDYMASLGDVYRISKYVGDGSPKWIAGDTEFSDEGTTGDDWGLLASFSGSSWSLNINKKGELNPSGGATNPVGIRVIAIDSDEKPTRSIALDRIVSFDADLPVIKNLYLVQSPSSAYDPLTDTASREYTDDMWVRGEWYITGTATDSDSIKKLTIGTTEIVFTGSDVSGTGWDTKYTDSGKIVHFKYKISTATGVGNVAFKLTAEDNAAPKSHTSPVRSISVNYDNTPPTLTTTGSSYKIDPKVRQSNNFYTLGSQVAEVSENDNNQSGFARTAFYFLRRDLASATKSYSIFDPMMSKGSEGNKVNIESAIDASGVVEGTTADGTVVYKSGLYWKYKKLTRDGTNLSSLTLKDGSDPNIHAGGLVEIGNAVYTIQSVSGTTVTIDGNPQASYVSALFAISLVVDNTITESSYGPPGTADGYGYGYNFPLNDDGDRMIEGVSKSGTSWTWEANVCSKNIPDGPIEIHYVVFDKAGNISVGTSGNVAKATYSGYSTKEVSEANNAYYVFGKYTYVADTPAFVSNNAPRIAGVQVGSDFNNDGTIGAGEWNTSRAAPASYDAKTLGTSMTLGSAAEPLLTAKGITAIKPEIVGGNGAIFYKFNYLSPTATNPAAEMSGSNATNLGTGTDDDSLDYLSAITLQIGDLLLAGKTTATLGDEFSMPFAFTLWDSTEGTTVFTNSQRVDITVHMGVQVKDTESPKASITPFHWASASDNSVYNKKGHIELEADWALVDATVKAKLPVALRDSDPKVSGQIVIKGAVSDNRQLSALYMNVTGMTANNRLDGAYDSPPAGIASSVTEGGVTYYLVATCAGGTWTGLTDATTYTNRGFNFAVDPSAYDASGHKTSWTFTWNTEMMTSVAATDVGVRILALDRGIPACVSRVKTDVDYDSAVHKHLSVDGIHYYADPTFSGAKNSGNASDQTTVATPTSRYRMDVVPYIVGVKTSLSTLKQTNSSVYDRTSSGNYPVNSSLKASFYGFNLVSGGTVSDSASTAHTTTLGSADNSTYAGYTVYPAAVSSFTSGNVSVAVNSVSSLNNANLNSAKGTYNGTTSSPTGEYGVYQNYYNRQPNNDSNNLLVDDVVLDVWEVKIGAIPSRGALTDPVMRINPANNIIGFAFVNGPANFSMSNGIRATPNSYETWQYNYADFSNVSFIYDSLGNAHGTVVGLDTEPTQTPALGGDFTYVTSKWGVCDIGNVQDNYRPNNKLRMESIGVPAELYVKGSKVMSYGSDSHGLLDTHKYRSPSIAVATHGTTTPTTTTYLAYYDDIQEQIRFRYGEVVPDDRGEFGQFQDENGNQTGTGQSIFEASRANFSVLAGKDNDLSSIPAYEYIGVTFAANSATITHNGANTLSVGAGFCFRSTATTPSLPAEIATNTTVYYVHSVISATQFTVAASQTATTPITFTTTGSTMRAYTATIPTIDTGNVPGEYLAIDVIPGTNTTTDTVVAVWYNGTDLKYSYKTNPCNDYNAGSGSGNGYWSPAKTIFSNAGEYCTIKVDALKGIHIAAYDTNGADLRYAYMPTYVAPYDADNPYDESTDSCVVDSYAITGTSITIDTMNNIPYISYYMPSTQKTKMAYLAKPLTGAISDLKGVANDLFTGNWEITLIPTTSRVQDDRVNIGLWKLGGGYSTTNGNSGGPVGTWVTPSTTGGTCYGNGTNYPVVGYAVKSGTAGAIEISQKK